MWKNRENIHFCIYKKCHLTTIRRLNLSKKEPLHQAVSISA